MTSTEGGRKMGHTETPWEVGGAYFNDEVRTPSGGIIASVYDGTREIGTDPKIAADNAAHIVRCVNEHATLTATIERMRGALEPFAKMADAYGEIVNHAVVADSRNSWKDNYAQITVGDYRRALSALASAPPTGKNGL